MGDGTGPTRKPRRLGCLGCMGFLLAVVLVGLAGLWGYGQYKTAAAARQERIEQETLTAEQRQKIERMQQNALMDPLLSTEAMDRRIAEAAPDADPDQDGLDSEAEVSRGTDPLSPDTDGDGLMDGDEVTKYGSDPLQLSTAGDGVSDLVKVLEQVDPGAKLPPYKEAYTQEYPDLGVSVRTTDPSSRHLHAVEPFHSRVIDSLGAVREPVIIREFTGEVSVTYPADLPNPKRIRAYYYDLEQRKLVEIEGQKNDTRDRRITFNAEGSHPILLLDMDERPQVRHTFYIVQWLKTSRSEHLPPHTYLIEIDATAIIGEVNEHPSYTHYRVPPALEPAWLQPWYELMEKNYADDGEDLREVLDVRRVEMTLGEARQMAAAEIAEAPALPVPWVAPGLWDSGFRVDVNGFSFANLPTTVSPGGICAGFSTIAERLYNAGTFPQKDRWTSDGSTAKNKQKAFAYDWTLAGPAYESLYKRRVFDYKLSDGDLLAELAMQHTVDSSQFMPADRELIRALELHWTKFNEEFNDGFLRGLKRKFSRDHKDAALIEELQQHFASGHVVTVLLLGRTGHALNGYRLEQDEADPDVFYLDLYDNNFPNNEQKGKDGPEDVAELLRIKLMRKKQQGLWGTGFGKRDVFEFEFPAYKLSSAKGGRVYFVKDGVALFE